MADREGEIFRRESSAPVLFRPRQGRVVAGVCAGIARWFGWNPTAVRIAYIGISVMSAAFPGILAYFVLWLLMPGDPRGSRSSRVE